MKQRNHVLRVVTILLLLSLAWFISTGSAIAQTETPTTETTTETPTEVAATETPTEVAATETPTEVPATETPTEVPATETPTEVAATETPTEVRATETPTEVPPTVAPTEPTDELSSIVIYKLFCASIDETAEDPCIGRVEAAEGTTVDFVVTEVETGYAETFGVPIEVYDGVTIGAILITEVPLGAYEITELVPSGYEGFAAPLIEDQAGEGNTLSVLVEPEEAEALFVNVPLGQVTPGTTPVPGVGPPAVTPGVEVPIDAPATESFGTATTGKATADTEVAVEALPATGHGSASRDTGWVAWLVLAVAVPLGMLAAGFYRRAQR